MAEVKTNNKVILKNDSSFPEHFDFEWLRNKGLEHIGQLSGKIWTDHNTHDPGITMMELLCYALIDLGYRTKLPIEDLLAKKENEDENNFFTPAEILSCNPTTIMDYRKMLMDIDGVQNAWLEVVKDERLLIHCPPLENSYLSCYYTVFEESGDGEEPNESIPPNSSEVILNGLYKVYIELENDDPYCLNQMKIPLDDDVSEDQDTNEEESEENPNDDVIENPVITEVRKRLSRYRNLCEDFTEIHTLCTEEIGLCADIELTDTANPEDVYVAVMEKINSFLTPQIQYHTLQGFLDKGKTIEEAFEGRPYFADTSKTDECGEAIIESRGFIDCEELRNIERHTSIHLSDIYKLLLEIEGVASIQKLELTGWIENTQVESSHQNPTLDQEGYDDRCWNWELPLHKNYVPKLSLECTCLNLRKGGGVYKVSKDEIEQLLRSAILEGNALLLGEDNLDMPIPKGTYRADLSDYYSIQNDLPSVYGVGEGGIPDSATNLRKAQARQLKGYLLFYDQLLAKYVSQIGNLRNLFSLKPDSERPDNTLHTYFATMLDSVPQAEQLLQFYDNTKNKALDGTILGLLAQLEPTNLQLEELERKKDFECKVEQYFFDKKSERDIAINQLQREFRQGDVTTTICEDECGYFFVMRVRFRDYIIVSRKHYKTHNEAQSAAESTNFFGALPKAYQKKIMIVDDAGVSVEKYTFSISYEAMDYLSILQNMVENEEQYCKRREEFLDHLLSRFAENFNEYVLLNYTLGLDAKQRIERKGQFLSKYPEISRNRGRAFDYCQPSWGTDNISGFENKIATLAGFSPLKQFLCNFQLYCPDENERIICITDPKGNVVLKSECVFESEEEALRVLIILLKKCIVNKDNYGNDVSEKKLYRFYIECEGCKFYYAQQFETKRERDTARKVFCSCFVHNTSTHDDFLLKEEAGKWRYYCWWRIVDGQSVPAFQSIKLFKTKEQALNNYEKDLKRIGKATLKTSENGTGEVFLEKRKTPSMESYQKQTTDGMERFKEEFEFYQKLLRANPQEFQESIRNLITCPVKFKILKKEPIAIYPCECYEDGDTDLQTKKDIIQYNIQNYKIPEISFCGEVTLEVDGKYHYILRDKNTGRVYLISYEGYPTVEAAIAALRENYLELINWASDINNYSEITFEQGEALCFLWTIGIPGEKVPLAYAMIDLEQGPQELAECLCAYPIRIKKEQCCSDKETTISYYFHLIDPDFEPPETEGEEVCKTDWRSTKCYDTPKEAMDDFNVFWSLLQNEENIECIPSTSFTQDFDEEDCNCKSYISIREILVESCDMYDNEELAWEGVNDFVQCANNLENYILCEEDGLYTFQIWTEGNGNSDLLEECQPWEAKVPEETGGTKLAQHPLCCEDISAVKNAVRRLLDCINQEGIHLVEHILLRPDCDPTAVNDCIIQPNDVDCCCKLEYEIEGGIACTTVEEETIKYIPGADTYSFWATVVLPGWTPSFSTLNQRDLFQELLYKNTPAHISLNILWVSPQQMCEFENKYTQWLQELQSNCTENDNIKCEMVNCLADLTDYVPTPKEEETVSPDEACPCSEATEERVGINTFKVYTNYRFYNYSKAPNSADIKKLLLSADSTNFSFLSSELAYPLITFDTQSIRTMITDFKKPEIILKIDQKTTEHEPVGHEEWPTELHERRESYIANLVNIDDVVMTTDRVMYEDTMNYLQSASRSFEDYKYVADRIFQYGQMPGGVETDLFFYLLCNATWNYLDIAVWKNRRNVQHEIEWQEIISRMKEDNIDRPKLLKGWNARELKLLLEAKSVGRYYRMIRAK